MTKISNIMGRVITQETQRTVEVLHALGARIRRARKDLGLTAQDVADAAGISRVTLHRIEKGEPSVTMAAYANVMQMVGLPLTVPADVKADADADAALPERNARLLDETNLSHAERRLLELLRREFEVAPRV